MTEVVLVIFAVFAALAAPAAESHFYVRRARRRNAHRTQALPTGRLPPFRDSETARNNMVSVFISALLENEVGVLDETLSGFLALLDDPGPVEVTLVCNGPRVDDFLRRLSDLERRQPAFKVLYLPGSKSKAENLNIAISGAVGSIVGVFDADAKPAPDVVRRAVERLNEGWDLVQGAKLVGSRSTDGALTRLVTRESLQKFFLDSPQRFYSSGLAYISGSNFFARRASLGASPFDSACLTEDIDCSVRLITRGVRITTDPAIVSFESAPPTWFAWVRQRHRWAAGWCQLLFSGQMLRLLRCSSLPVNQRVGWLYLVLGRRLAPGIVFLAVLGWLVLSPLAAIGPLWFAASILGGYLLAMALWQRVLLAASSEYEAYGRVPIETGGAVCGEWMVLVLWPLYESIKCVVAVVAFVYRPRTWVVTPRPESSSHGGALVSGSDASDHL